MGCVLFFFLFLKERQKNKAILNYRVKWFSLIEILDQEGHK